MPVQKVEPNFERLRTALLAGEPDRVPLLELAIDRSIQSAFLGRPVVTLEDVVEFHIRAGYDAVRLQPKIDMNPGKFQPREGMRISEASETDRERRWYSEGTGIITSMEDFERYIWPRPEDVDYSPLEQAAKLIPDSMALIGQYGDIFTWIWEMMGFETFSFAIYENPELIECMFEKVGSIVYNLFENMVTMEKVKALWYSDDIAFKSGLLVSPELLRKYLFPWMKKIGELCRKYNVPFIYHSDGKLWDVMEDLLDCGIHALHPIEPQAMDIREVKRRYGDRLCLIGNVDLEYTLTRGTPEDVRKEVLALLRDVAPGGGYCLGSANTVTNYVKPENYRTMVETVLEFGWYPIQIN